MLIKEGNEMIKHNELLWLQNEKQSSAHFLQTTTFDILAEFREESGSFFLKKRRNEKELFLPRIQSSTRKWLLPMMCSA